MPTTLQPRQEGGRLTPKLSRIAGKKAGRRERFVGRRCVRFTLRFGHALAQELNKTEPVTEWISHECEPAPLEGNDGLLKLRSTRNGFLHYGFDFLYDKIEMDRRPMTFVATTL